MPTRSAVAFISSLIALLLATPLVAQEPEPAAPAGADLMPVGTMSELMVHVVYPASDAIFYVGSRTPTTSEEWGALEMKALMLAESAVLMMLPAHARDQDQWMVDARLLRDAARDAFRAAQARDVDALIEINDPLYESCVSCHLHYRPDYGQ